MAADPPAPAPAQNDQEQQPAPGPEQPVHPAPASPAVPVSQLNPTIPVPNQPAQPVPQIIHQQVLNWSHFKPEFAGRPEEDVEAHHLCHNDWMVTHNFPQDVRVQRFCLTLVERLGYGISL